ncbi:predicted protein [Sparassis crispa]|uniref:Mitotic checkpoint regulator, MAD2B-interacting-domain-containing protein n=1 Tax=Sparassis crispa TaxID=139825 RepID=A0A401GIE3_9APHY|nr:predicted protein [Sparassis crispa]GBE81939.1 predicted protein [Sparassis crispa]
MLGVEGYGSDSDSDAEARPTPSTSNSTSQPTPHPKQKSAFSLPPPKSSTSAASTSKSSGGPSLPPPKTKRIKKITIGLPELPPEDDDDVADERPVAKKPRLESGARSSALLSMLPAPKNKAPVLAAPQRVLGGGRGPGLVFNAAPSRPSRKATVEDAADEEHEVQDDTTKAAVEVETEKKSPPFLPPSLLKGKANVSVEEKNELPKSVRTPAPAVDFFSLGSSTSPPSPSLSTKRNVPKPTLAPSAAPSSLAVSSFPLPLLPGISSAPNVDDFVPPKPTPQDPYPGYYLLPSGAWAAYDAEYYRKFYDKWKREYDAHVRAMEKGTAKGFEALESEGAQEVNAQREMEKAKREIQELEERKALTKGDVDAAGAPKMNIKGAALGGRARTRHQLSTLLTEAYQNREALEERIAQGRRNRKEAGNKYGF